MSREMRRGLIVAAALVAVGAGAGRALGQASNKFANAGFEMGGSLWHLDKAGKTDASYAVDKDAAPAGQYSALVTIGAVEDWGVQFGQTMQAGKVGATYTFAAVARSAGEPVTVALNIERSARPWDRAARTESIKLTRDKWTELHVTFKLDKPFPEGWFAYIMCKQPNCRFRVDMFRLYEGAYVPYEQAAATEAASAGVRVYDTVAPSARPLPAEALSKKPGWTELPEGAAARTFKGDAVVMNNRVAFVLRPGGRGVEVYSLEGAPAGPKATLVPLGAADAQSTKLQSARLLDVNPGGARVEATFQADGGSSLGLRCELGMGQVHVQTEPLARTEALRVEAPCRFAVLPDFFADDIVVDAADLPGPTAELPSERFCLQMTDEGSKAVVMTVASQPHEAVTITLSGEGDQRTVQAVHVPYGKDGKVWAAVLAGPNVWHHTSLAANQAGKAVALDWARPFAAQWRVDWTKDDGLIDSWEMLEERPDGSFTKHGWFGGPGTIPRDRKRWTTVLGSFQYPCWIDRGGRGFLQPLTRHVKFQGPVLIYPINRAADTPLEQFTVVDIVRATLGVGPCEYVLDLEGQRNVNKGIATCGCRDTLNPIYSRNQQKQQRDKIEKTLKDVVTFITYIRERINGYVAFGHSVREYLAGQKKARPELAGPLDKLDALAGAIDDYVAARQAKIKTPAHAAAMAEEFRQTVLDYEGPDALAKCKRFTSAWVEIGGNQDELVGECRLAVKILRQRAGLLLAAEPRLGEVTSEIRRRAQQVLRNPAGHEGARH